MKNRLRFDLSSAPERDDWRPLGKVSIQNERTAIRTLIVCALLLALCPAVLCQTSSAITGHVTDEQGANVAGRVDEVPVADDPVEDAVGRVVRALRVPAEASPELALGGRAPFDPGDVDRFRDGRVHTSRADERDADVVAAEVEAQNLGDAAQPELRGAVGRVPRQPEQTRG